VTKLLKLTEEGGEEASRECPNCHSRKIVKDGMRETRSSTIQRFLCKECWRRFSESAILSTESINTGKRQVCAILTEAKNLATATETKTVAGEQQEAEQKDVKGKILEFAWHLRKQGHKNTTITSYTRCLKTLCSGGADLRDPESVKETLALSKKWNDTSKTTIAIVFGRFLRFMGSSWERPKYRPQKKLYFIPSEQEINNLIAGSGKKTATILQLLKECGCRIGEALAVTWKDIDEQRQTITINSPEKYNEPRIFHVSNKLIAMIKALPKQSEKVFNKTNVQSAELNIVRARKKVAGKLQNPRLKQITYHTLRHWKATMEYHKTKDLLHVKQILGHRKIDSTLVYVSLEAALFQTENDEFHVKTARTQEELKSLLEVGFEYICEKDGLAFLRKRK